jgi:IS5 family transposase
MADRAYDTRAFRAHLVENGIVNHVLHAARHNKPLTREQAFINTWIAPLRRCVEKIFGPWKRSWGYRRTRYRCLERNRIQLAFIVTAWNLLRASKLKPV